MNVIGGRAHRNGLFLRTEDFGVRVTLEKDGTVHTQKWRYINDRGASRWLRKLLRVPFVRGLAFCLDLVRSNWRLIVLPALLITVISALVTYWAENSLSGQDAVSLINWVDTAPLLLIAVAALWVGKFTRIRKFHGAEHKAFWASRCVEEVTREDIQKASRVNRYCGTNYGVYVLLLYGLLWYFGVPDFLSIPICLSVGYEIWQVEHPQLVRLLDPVHRLGNLVQRWLATAEPGEEELATAYLAILTLRQMELAAEAERLLHAVD